MTGPADREALAEFLQRQIEKSAAVLDLLPKEIRDQLTHRTRPTDQTLDLRGQNATLRTELAEAQQERDEWHRRANDMNRAIGAAGAEHLRNRGALIRELADLRAELATVTEERDQWHRLAVESDRENERLSTSRDQWLQATRETDAALEDMTAQRDQAIYERDSARAQVAL